jgi:hypothetical protein
MFSTNLLIFVFGGLIFGFSLWANLDQKFAEHLTDIMRQAKIDATFVEKLQDYQASLWILTAVGALLFLVGFLGCCGAACESLVLMTLVSFISKLHFRINFKFFIIVLVLSIIEAFALIYLLVNRSGFLTALYDALQRSSQSDVGVKNLKPVEDLMTCCGATAETAFKYVCEGKLKGAVIFFRHIF